MSVVALHPLGTPVRLSDPAEYRILDSRTGHFMSLDQSGPNYKNALASYIAAQLTGDPTVALRHLDDLIDAGFAPGEIRRRVVREAQQEIGRLWQADRITVAQEHAATAIGQVALAHLFGCSRFATRRGVN